MNLFARLRSPLVATFLAALILPAGSASAKEPSDPPRRPNILFLFSDDQRADTIAALGNKHIKTPNLDRLARDGTAFTRAYCMGAQQEAVCVPSRAMLMTGRTLFHVSENFKGQPTWPEVFARAGYSTFLTGKWHNGLESAQRIFPEGKSVFFGGMGDPYKLPVRDLTAGAAPTAPRDSGKHSVELFADSAVDFLKRQKGERPFLCYVPFNAPHDPRLAPKEYHQLYDPATLPLPANFLPEHPFNSGDLTIRDERLAPWPRTPEIVRRHLADYYAAITFLDAQIGRILEALKASGQESNTLIVFTSDHGLALGSHGLFGKQNLYDHSMHSPLLLAGPGVPRGKQSDALCYLLDVYPTLGELAGVKPPEGSEGKSLAPVLAGREAKVRESLFFAYTKVQRAVRDERWKLIVYPQVNKVQLFDLQNDPAERKDLSGDPAHAGEVERLTALLRDWQKQLGDALPLRSDKPQPLEFDFRKVPPVKKPQDLSGRESCATLSLPPRGRWDYDDLHRSFMRPRGRDMVTTTHISLIAGLRDEAPQAWGRFNRTYRPWLLDWTRQRLGFQAEDAEDVVQQVLAALLEEFQKQRTGERPVFQHNGRTGVFRSWLRTILHHRALAHVRSQRLRQGVANAEEVLAQLSDPHSALSGLWNQQHEQQVIHQAWDTLKSELPATIWRPVGEVLFKERRSREVADEFRIPLRTFYSHQKLVKDRMRELLDGLLD